MKRIAIVSLAATVLLFAGYLLSERYSVRDGEAAYQGRTGRYSGVAMAVLSYYPSKHNGELPKSLQDPALQEPVAWSYEEMKKQVVFNPTYLGRKVDSLTEAERKSPLILEKEIRPTGDIVICDHNGEVRRLTPAELGATDLPAEVRAELVGVLPKEP